MTQNFQVMQETLDKESKAFEWIWWLVLIILMVETLYFCYIEI